MAVELPAHVWVRKGQVEVPGVLFRWQWQGAEWWGWVVAVESGEPLVELVRGDLLRPVER